jgi:hypothetical protein
MTKSHIRGNFIDQISIFFLFLFSIVLECHEFSECCVDVCYILPPFQNIRCFSFMKQVYLDIF